MLRGYLKILTLIALKKGRKSGYALMKLLEQSLGRKPSPGSVYPMLNSMLRQRLVRLTEIERRKEYSITKRGVDYIKQVSETECDNITRMIRALAHTREELKVSSLK